MDFEFGDREVYLILHLEALLEDWAGVCSVLCEFPKSVLLELKGRKAMFGGALLSLSYLFRWSVTGIKIKKKNSARKHESQWDTI